MFINLLLIIFSQISFAGSAGDAAKFEPRYIIDMPNAGILREKHINFSALSYTDGGVMLDFTAAFLTNFNVSMSYGASRVIGSGTPVGQKYPGISVKYRVFNEKEAIPAITFGVSNQGRGNWIKSSNRFETLSPGAYIALSKNFHWSLGDVSFHGGLGYSFEPEPDKRLPNIWAGVEQNMGNNFALVSELNFMIDNRDSEISSNIPLLNLGIKWSASDDLTLQLQFRDILGTYKQYNEFTRYFGFDFITPF